MFTINLVEDPPDYHSRYKETTQSYYLLRRRLLVRSLTRVCVGRGRNGSDLCTRPVHCIDWETTGRPQFNIMRLTSIILLRQLKLWDLRDYLRFVTETRSVSSYFVCRPRHLSTGLPPLTRGLLGVCNVLVDGQRVYRRVRDVFVVPRTKEPEQSGWSDVGGMSRVIPSTSVVRLLHSVRRPRLRWTRNLMTRFSFPTVPVTMVPVTTVFVPVCPVRYRIPLVRRVSIRELLRVLWVPCVSFWILSSLQ